MATPFPSRGFLPFDNPVSQWVEPRRNALMGLSAGFLSGDPSRAMTGAMQGAQLDQQYSQLQAEQAQEAEQTNMTKEWLRQRGRDDLLPLVDAGQGMFALQQATQPAEAPGSNLMEVGGQLYNPEDGSWISPPQSSVPSMSGMPSSYQEYVLSQQDPGYAQFRATPAAPKPPTEAERKAGALTTVTQKDAGLLFGNNTPENPGIFDALGGWGDSALQANIPFTNAQPLAGLASSDFKVAKDAISNITQSYLYAMSGATAPPEEVRKIAEQVTPQPFDSPAQKQAKRDRLLAMYQAIEGAQGNAARQPQNDGWVDAGNGIRIRELP